MKFESAKPKLWICTRICFHSHRTNIISTILTQERYTLNNSSMWVFASVNRAAALHMRICRLFMARQFSFHNKFRLFSSKASSTFVCVCMNVYRYAVKYDRINERGSNVHRIVSHGMTVFTQHQEKIIPFNFSNKY